MYHIAQINVARMRFSIDDPGMADFVAQLDAVNGLADRSPGFVWRLQGEAGDATTIQAFDEANILINMSVWETIDALFDFTYKSGHTDVFRRRHEWFDTADGAHLALWWIRSGQLPRVEQGIARLKYLDRHGPSARAFTIKHRFDPPLRATGTGD